MKTIKDVNFLPDYIQVKHLRTKKKVILFLCTFFALIITSGFLLIPKLVYGYYEREMYVVDSKLAQLSEVQRKVDILNELNNKKAKKASILNEVNNKQVRVTELIDTIKNAIPYNTSLKSYAVNDKNIIVSFEIHSPLEIIALITSLEELDIFEKVEANTFPIVDKTTNIGFNLKLK